MTRLPSLQPQLLHPQASLQWKRCADAPVEMSRVQAVVMGEKVYVEATKQNEDCYSIYKYGTSEDEWNRLPPHHVCFFAMAQFTGNLITVGGNVTDIGPIGKVYRFKEESQEWEEFLKPMPTARAYLNVTTSQSAIIASGGGYW